MLPGGPGAPLDPPWQQNPQPREQGRDQEKRMAQIQPSAPGKAEMGCNGQERGQGEALGLAHLDDQSLIAPGSIFIDLIDLGERIERSEEQGEADSGPGEGECEGAPCEAPPGKGGEQAETNAVDEEIPSGSRFETDGGDGISYRHDDADGIAPGEDPRQQEAHQQGSGQHGKGHLEKMAGRARGALEIADVSLIIIKSAVDRQRSSIEEDDEDEPAQQGPSPGKLKACR